MSQLGSVRKHYTRIDSTNLEAKRLIETGAEEGLLVTADYQTEGRGRQNRSWYAQHSENVLASYVLFPPRGREDWGGLPLLAGLAVQYTLLGVADLQTVLKWPNDVLAYGKKISGVLVESGTSRSGTWAVVGIGVNVNQLQFAGEFKIEPTSVYLEVRQRTDIDLLISRLSQELSTLYTLWCDEGNEAIIAKWKESPSILGTEIVVHQDDGKIHGTAKDIGADGSLIVETRQGETAPVYAGDVTIEFPTKD